MLQAIDLTKRYEDNQLALDHISFTVNEGEIFCMLGDERSRQNNRYQPFSQLHRSRQTGPPSSTVSTLRRSHWRPRSMSLTSRKTLCSTAIFTARQNLDFFARLGGKKNLTKEDYYSYMRNVGLPEKAFEMRTEELLERHAPESGYHHRHHQGCTQHPTGRTDIRSRSQGRGRVYQDTQKPPEPG